MMAESLAAEIEIVDVHNTSNTIILVRDVFLEKIGTLFPFHQILIVPTQSII